MSRPTVQAMRFETDANYQMPFLGSVDKVKLKATIFVRLRELLDSHAVPQEDYVLGGEGSSGQLCITLDRSLWTVFRNERGAGSRAAFFARPWEAANYFLWEVMREHRDLFSSHIAVGFAM
jgi:hypothetical protein